MKYFISDTHFGHEQVITKMGRKFTNIDEHDSLIIDAINSTVTKADILFILGDFAFCKEEYYFKQLKCKDIRLVIGNHDRLKKVFKHFFDITDIEVTKVHDVDTVLCHYPMAYWPGSHHGHYHLYGHIHNEYNDVLDRAFPGRRSIDVCVENAMLILGSPKPFSEDNIRDLLSIRPGHHFVVRH